MLATSLKGICPKGQGHSNGQRSSSRVAFLIIFFARTFWSSLTFWQGFFSAPDTVPTCRPFNFWPISGSVWLLAVPWHKGSPQGVVLNGKKGKRKYRSSWTALKNSLRDVLSEWMMVQGCQKSFPPEVDPCFPKTWSPPQFSCGVFIEFAGTSDFFLKGFKFKANFDFFKFWICCY